MRFMGCLSSILLAAAFSANLAVADENDENIQSAKSTLSESGCLTNNAFTQICNGWSMLSSQAEEAAFTGDPVCITFEAKSLSRSKNELSGLFLGHSGVFAEDIYVIADISEAKLPNHIKVGDLISLRGLMPQRNVFRDNSSDNCFVYIDAQEIAIDGF